MTNEEMRIACAEEMGWKHIPPDTDLPWGGGAVNNLEWMFLHQLPNYPSDLNAAITLVDNLLGEGYGPEKWMVKISRVIDGEDMVVTLERSLPHAICRAFLEVKGRWKE